MGVKTHALLKGFQVEFWLEDMSLALELKI